MNKLISKSAFFLLGLIILSLPISYIIKRDYIGDYEKVNLNYDQYLLADSHGEPIGERLESGGIYNFSAPSDSYFDMYRKIKYLINNTDVKRIILTVGDHTLSPYRAETNNLDRSKFYADKSEFKSYIDYFAQVKVLNKIPFLNIKARYIVKSRINALFSRKKSNDNKTLWSNLSIDEKESICIDRYERQFDQKESSEELTSKLIEIIQLCSINDIELIGIKFPLTKIYCDVMGTNNYGADEIFKNNNLEILDFKEEYIYNPVYFLDQDHMNDKGSDEFSKLFISKISK